MINRVFIVLHISALFFVLSASAFAAPQTMRLDYYHTGGHQQELFSLDRVVIEPLPWPGDLSKAIDDTNLGKYFFEVKDQTTKRVLYSRGFASIYGEWETTDEAKSIVRTFQESLRFPAPATPVEVVLKKRDARNVFRDLWSTVIDPQDQFIDRSKSPAPAPVITIQKTGDPATKVDFLILGDGYTAAEAQKFEADARRLTEVLFATSPFKEHRKDFNVWALCPPAAESGISRPSSAPIRSTNRICGWDPPAIRASSILPIGTPARGWVCARGAGAGARRCSRAISATSTSR